MNKIALFLGCILVLSQAQFNPDLIPDFKEQENIGKQMDECLEGCTQDDIEERSNCFTKCFDLVTPKFDEMEKQFDIPKWDDDSRKRNLEGGDNDWDFEMPPMPEFPKPEDFEFPSISEDSDEDDEFQKRWEQAKPQFDDRFPDIPEPSIPDFPKPEDIMREDDDIINGGGSRRRMQEQFKIDQEQHKKQIEERINEMRKEREEMRKNHKFGGAENDLHNLARQRVPGMMEDENLSMEERRAKFEEQMECNRDVSDLLRECRLNEDKSKCNLDSIKEKCKKQACEMAGRFKIDLAQCE